MEKRLQLELCLRRRPSLPGSGPLILDLRAQSEEACSTHSVSGNALSGPLGQQGTAEKRGLCAVEVLDCTTGFSPGPLGWFLVTSGSSLLLSWAEGVQAEGYVSSLRDYFKSK